MVYKISDNILSPLGETSEANYLAVKEGRSALRLYEGKWNIPEPFYGSLLTDEQNAAWEREGFTRFEALVIRSIESALSNITIPLDSDRVVFVLSTTKANIDELDTCEDYSSLYPGVSAERIAHYFGIQTMPIVVCNACISGVSAIITGQRLLESGAYDYAIICGADCQSKFIISGFQSLKALSAQHCRPFDLERLGLNLGEAAATIVLASREMIEPADHLWSIVSGAVHNDGFHISSPSPKGEGSCACLTAVLKNQDLSDLAFINLHGTATMYNDQMESKAVQGAGLTDYPVNALKGYYGHTMGAAGVLETLLSMYAIEDHTIPGTKGYAERGVSGHLNLTSQHSSTEKNSFVKLISGFGGCNAAIYAVRGSENQPEQETPSLKSLHRVEITPDSIILDGEKLDVEGQGKSLLSYVYKNKIGGYPKFHKMDLLCKLGFIASELLIEAEGDERFTTHTDRGVILLNKTSSIVADKEYQESIREEDNYYPSPSSFVYTLPNIVTGEIALRNHYHGETSFYILPEYDEKRINQVLTIAFRDPQLESIIGGWIDCESDQEFYVNLELIVKQ